MNNSEKVLVFGHKKPDTDSIAGSIAVAYLKNKLGINAEARVLGNPNNETKFALDYFNVDTPRYLNDIKTKIKDIDFLKNYTASEKDSIYDGFIKMTNEEIGAIPIVNKENKLVGLVSLKDIAKGLVSGDISNLCTSYTNIVKALNAKEILKFDDEIIGNIFIASYKSATFIETVDLDSSSILIVGDRYSIIEHAIQKKVKMIILTGKNELANELLEAAKQNKVNIIYANDDTFKTSRKIGMANYVSSVMTKQEIITINMKDDINDFIDISKKYKYSNYPVINDDNEYVGLIRLSDVTDIKKRKVILVDHNEAVQSVDGLEEAEIIEIIDHHKIGTIGTSMPISFRNMPIGSSNTIIYMLYKENGIEIPKNIAGLMLSGIISDTLLFKSPTTTQIDIDIAKSLATIAEVDIESYGMEMLKAGSSLKGKTKEEILYTDFKNFTIDDKKVGVGQITTFNIDEILNDKDEYVKLINDIAANNDYAIVALFATDIIKNGSYMLYNESAKDILDNCFEIKDLYEGYYLDGCVSRKKQIIPKIMNILEKK